jgi:CTP synthase
MRLGRRTTHFVNDDSVVKKLYGGVNTVDERHRHRYEVNPIYIEEYEQAGMKFVGRSEDNQRMEIIELESKILKICIGLNNLRFVFSDHPYFVGVQYHPEYISRPLKPSAPYLGLIWVYNFFIYSLSSINFLLFRLHVEN